MNPRSLAIAAAALAAPSQRVLKVNYQWNSWKSVAKPVQRRLARLEATIA